MAKTITRQTLKLFGKDGATSNFGQFGSQAAGVPVTTKAIATIQSLTAWLDGWQDAVAAGQAPYLQDMNSLLYVLCYQMCSMLQDGIGDWDAGTSYYIGSEVRRTGTSEVYASKIDDSVNQALPTAGTSDSNWQFVSGVIGGIFRVGGVLAMNSSKITGLAAGTTAGDALRYEQLIGVYLALAGGTMGGAIAMGANGITGLANGAAAQDAAAYGQLKIVQTAYFNAVNNFSTTNLTFTSTGVAATITPKSTSNKILVMCSGPFEFVGSVGQTAQFTIDRNGTNIGAVSNGFYPGINLISSGTNNTVVPMGLIIMDSPASVAALTYTAQIKVGTCASAYFGRSSVACTMTLLEVAP